MDAIFQGTIVPILLTLAGSFTTWAIAHLPTLVRSLTARVKNATLHTALAALGQAATDAVHELLQTSINDLKAARSDGKLTADEVKAAKDAAVRAAWGAITSDMRAAIAKGLGGLEGALGVTGQKVESAIAQAKAAGVASPNPKVASLQPDQKAKAIELARTQLGLATR